MSDVQLMVASGSKASRVYDYIRDNSPHQVQIQDVYKLITKIKKSDNKLTDEDEVAELLVECNLAAEGNVASVEENSRGQSAVVSINSQHMRKMYQRFPELLLVDCTHKTNRYNYQLCTLMVMDQFGIGQAIQHSVIERNADWHMMKIIEHFQSVNPWQKTNVIMVDKNLNDIHVLKSMVFDSRVLLCHFHVIKWLRGALRSQMEAAGKTLKTASSALGASAASSQSLLSAHSSANNVLAADDAAASAGNSVAGADLGPVTLATLQEAARAQKEWTKYVAFDEDGRILFSNVKPLDGEVAGFLKLFNKREDTMASGIVLLGEQYDVHRFHPPLVYGRRGDPSVEEGEGIAVCKVQQGGRTLYCLITYVYPTLSARAVPQLKEFCETLLAKLSG
ncbi:hypothetical protein C6341_g10788 [Phytophthora cactorum]|nr:hypothetical protein C6341_g10788 [Phytophthora cactorum]